MSLSIAAAKIALNATTLEDPKQHDRKDEIRFKPQVMLEKSSAPAGTAYLQGPGIPTLEQVDIRALEKQNVGLKAILQARNFDRGPSPEPT